MARCPPMSSATVNPRSIKLSFIIRSYRCTDDSSSFPYILSRRDKVKRKHSLNESNVITSRNILTVFFFNQTSILFLTLQFQKPDLGSRRRENASFKTDVLSFFAKRLSSQGHVVVRCAVYRRRHGTYHGRRNNWRVLQATLTRRIHFSVVISIFSRIPPTRR